MNIFSIFVYYLTKIEIGFHLKTANSDEKLHSTNS